MGFSGSTTFMTGNVYNDPTQGNAPTLFVSGHASAGYVSNIPSLAQISIPELMDIETVGVAGLKVATLLQPFADPTGGRTPLTEGGFCGYALYTAKLLGFCAIAYDATVSLATTAFVNSSLNLSQPNTAGAYRMGKVSQDMFGGYAAPVPPEWQASLGAKVVAGNGPWSITGANSSGPGLHTVDADALAARPPVGTKLDSTPLVYYPIDHQQLGDVSNLPTKTVNGVPVPSITVTDPWGRVNVPVGTGGPNWTMAYNDADSRVRGVLLADGTKSVLFFGTKGLGPTCYGFGTSDAKLHLTKAPGSTTLYCYDPASGDKGYHAYPVVPFVWAYDIDDLVAAKEGRKPAWMVFPYTGWVLKNGGAGVSWDVKTRRLYVGQAGVDKDPKASWPVIHVYQVGLGSTTNSSAGGVKSSR